MKFQKSCGLVKENWKHAIDEERGREAVAPWFRCIAARVMNRKLVGRHWDQDALDDLVDERFTIWVM